ncbi:hypothetical protein KI387_001331, partial [Taxus chinensis]
YPIFIHNDHATIKYLINKLVVSNRIIRWLLLLQEFDVTIVDKLGKDNVVVDFLSRMENNNEEQVVDDSFPDEHLFSISTRTPWYADIANYLVS